MRCEIHPTVVIEGEVEIGANVRIGPFCCIGSSYSDARREYYGTTGNGRIARPAVTRIGAGTFICPSVTIEKAAHIGSNCLIEHGAFIGESSRIGSHVFVRYGCQIYRNVEIGDNCIVSGFIANNTTIGNDVQFFGVCIHRYLGRKIGEPEPAPTICDNAFVGFDALIIGAVRIGTGAIIKAGAIVTRTVNDHEVISAGERR